jgi:hypothetical protein
MLDYGLDNPRQAPLQIGYRVSCIEHPESDIEDHTSPKNLSFRETKKPRS